MPVLMAAIAKYAPFTPCYVGQRDEEYTGDGMMMLEPL